MADRGTIVASKLKVAELKEQLSRRGLDTSGTKPELVKRLQTKLDEEEFNLDEDVEPYNSLSAKEDVEPVHKPPSPPPIAPIAPVKEQHQEVPKESEIEIAGSIPAPVVSESAKHDESTEHSKLSESQRQNKRAERFSATLPTKKIENAPSSEPAYTVVTVTDKSKLEVVLKKRAERFGSATTVVVDGVLMHGEDVKKNKRKERFQTEVDKELEDKALARKERFRDPAEVEAEEKNKKRKERFGAGAVPAEKAEKQPAVVVDPELAAKMSKRQARFAAAQPL